MKLIELTGKFINIYPEPFKREIVTDFDTMNTELVKIELGPFAINQYPVTNKEFHEFIRETGYSPVAKTDYLKHFIRLEGIVPLDVRI